MCTHRRLQGVSDVSRQSTVVILQIAISVTGIFILKYLGLWQRIRFGGTRLRFLTFRSCLPVNVSVLGVRCVTLVSLYKSLGACELAPRAVYSSLY
jgi:hypothetical protein